MVTIKSVSAFHYLLHPYPTSLVTCAGSDERPNIIAIAWLIPVSVDPPLVAMSVRPTRHSYSLLAQVPEFVVNIPGYELAQQTLYCGRRSGEAADKFAATGLTPRPARRVRPPIIAECVAHLECRVVDDIEAGDHRVIIAQVLDAYARPEYLDSDGLRSPDAVQPLLHLGKNRFHNLRGDSTEPRLPE